jgi:hypothetical protein
MTVTMKSSGIDFGGPGGSTDGLIQNFYDSSATALPALGSVSYFDVNVDCAIGCYHVLNIQPVNNTVFIRCTPVDSSGNVVPYSLSTMIQYGNAYSDAGAGNYTAATNSGLQWLNNQNGPAGMIIIEGAGRGAQSSFSAYSPKIQVRQVHQYYSNLTVQSWMSMTLGSSGVTSASDFVSIRVSASSGNLYGAVSNAIWKQ